VTYDYLFIIQIKYAKVDRPCYMTYHDTFVKRCNYRL